MGSPTLLSNAALFALDGLRRSIEAVGHTPRTLDLAGVPALVVEGGNNRAAGVLPVQGATAEGIQALRTVEQTHPGLSFRWLAFGQRPGPDAQARLRWAGVKLALYEPIDPAGLRFQLNRALAPSMPRQRGTPRAPANWAIQFRTRLRTRWGHLYTLSRGGAYLATDRPLRPGRRVTLEMPIGWVRPDVQGRVVAAHGPEVARGAVLPPGVAIRFGTVDTLAGLAIDRFVGERLAALTV